MRNSINDCARSGYWLIPLLWLAIVWMLAPYFGSDYSPDSYYYGMLGKNLLSGHGYVTTVIRENIPGADFHARSYPPVMPIAYGLVDRILKTGVASGLIVDLLALYAILHACYLINMRISPRFFYLLPVSCCALMMRNGGFYDELIAGRTIPVAIGIFMGLIYLIIEKETISSRRYIVIGMVLGLLYLTRYDALLFCLACPVFLCLARVGNIRNMAAMYIGILLIMSPWLVRNIVTFGQPFTSSNWGAVASLYDTDTPTIVFFSGTGHSGLEHPMLWLAQRMFWLCRDLQEICVALVPAGSCSVMTGSAVLCLNVIGLLRSKNGDAVRLFIGISVVWLVTDVITVAATKLPDLRYFTLAELLLPMGAVLAVLECVPQGTGARQPAAGRVLPSMLFAALVLGGTLYAQYPQIQKDDKRAILTKAYDDFNPVIQPGEMVACDVFADDFAYYTHWNMIYFPTNATSPADPDFIAWKEHFHVRYLIVMDQSGFLRYPMAIRAKSGPFRLIDLGGKL